ncbi:replication initiation protein, partial [Sporosarcina sp. BP05]|uniref:replication initiation protein n=1 Tax=Sporosarcina sp. BP05 TaxID=2758726 RepID=UPI0016471C70
MKDSYLVTQSNRLIEARHDVPLTVREQQIVLTMVSMIQPNDEDFRKYRISIKDFSEMLGLKGNAKYEEIKEIAKRLQKKSVYIVEKDGFVVTNWVSSQRYKEGEGVIELAFSPDLKPYLLQLKSHFTSYKLSNILSLKSTYSIRLYELLKKWQHLGKWTCPLEDLKIHLGAVTSTFDRYNLFKVRALEVAVNELNEKTDVNVVFEEVKKGRKVEKIEFRISKAPDKEIQLPEPKSKLEQPKKAPENEDVRTRLNGLADKKLYQFTQNYFSQLYQGALFIWGDRAEHELEMIIGYVNVEKSVQNPLGFIKSQIQLAWEAYERGEHTTFADLQPTKERTTGREEIIPDWFKKKDKSFEPQEK